MTRVATVGDWGVSSDPLPEFDRPPVIEVAVGVEFLPVDELDIVALVNLHNIWSGEYPKIRLQPELPSASRFASQLPVVFNTGVPPVRLWSLSDDENFLIQVQADRMVLNWRRISDAEYPHYANIVEQFQAHWSHFVDYLGRLGAPAPTPTVAEVTYVNSIQFNVSAGPVQILTFDRDVDGLWPAAALSIQRVLPIPVGLGHPGTLRLVANTEEPGALRLDLVARIELDPSVQHAFPRDALDFAHEVAVRGFSLSTTAAQQETWGRRN
jgi:uncharacterized protein (TIGR04255 family)